MPTYVYKREDGTTFEVMQKITEEPLETCPWTGQKVKRVIGGGAGLIFKGEGFYLTDYARKGQSTTGDEKPDGAAKSKSDSSGSAESGKSDSKAAAEKDST